MGVESAALSDVLVRVETGWSPTCEPRLPAPDEWGVLKLSAVTSGRFLASEAKALPKETAPRPALEVRPDDVLMSRANGVKALVGVVSRVVDVRPELMLPDLVFRLVANPDAIDAAYLGLALASNSARRQIEDLMRGSSGQYKISQQDVRALRVPAFTLAEQRQIAAAHAAFERRIAALERMRDKLRVVEQAVSTEAFTALRERDWLVVPLESIAEVAAGVTLGSEPVGDGTVELPYLRVANVRDGHIDTADVKHVRILGAQYDRYALREGDLLLTEGGDLDKLGRGAVWDGRIADCLHQNHVFRVRCGARMTPDFLGLYTASAAGRAYFQRVGKQTTNLASINSTQVKKMPVPLPTLDEQERLLGPVRAVRLRIASLDRQIVSLRTTQQAVLEDMLSGKVRVPAAV